MREDERPWERGCGEFTPDLTLMVIDSIDGSCMKLRLTVRKTRATTETQHDLLKMSIKLFRQWLKDIVHVYTAYTDPQICTKRGQP